MRRKESARESPRRLRRLPVAQRVDPRAESDSVDSRSFRYPERSCVRPPVQATPAVISASPTALGARCSLEGWGECEWWDIKVHSAFIYSKTQLHHNSYN